MDKVAVLISNKKNFPFVYFFLKFTISLTFFIIPGQT